MTKNGKRVFVVDAVILVMFLIIAFVVPFKMDGVFWLSILFGIISIGSQLYVLKIAFENAEDARSRFYGFPIVKIGVTYMIVQIVLSLALMTADIFVKIPAWIPAASYILAFGISAIGFIAADATREGVEHLERKFEADTTWMQNLRSVTASLPGQVSDLEVKKMLAELSDAFRYSDPVSSDVTAHIEKEITALVTELQNAVTRMEQDAVKERCGKITAQLKERNRICKLNKKK